MNDKMRGAILLGVTATVFITVFVFVAPIPQPLAYHQFADDRTLAEIPRALNVLSNVGFLIVGLLGLQYLLANAQKGFARPAERWPYIILFIGITLTCFGSGYYHLAPDN